MRDAAPGGHLIVCGDNQLAYRITLELTSRYGEAVTVLLPSRDEGYGPDISGLPRVTVIERPALTSAAFTEAGVASARALALVWQDDVGNFHAALRAQELNPDLRLVFAVFNRRLGEHVRGFFNDCTVLSGTAMASPSFVAAARGETAPSHVRVAGRTLYVPDAAAAALDQAVCRISVPDDPAGSLLLLPPDTADSHQLVLAVADGTPRDPLAAERHPVREAAAVARRLAWNRYALLFGLLLGVALAGFGLLLTVYSPGDAAYLGFMDLTGSALTGVGVRLPEKIAQVILTADGMASLPVVTALIVGARLTGRIRGEPRPRGGHIIVCGLGNVGTRIVGELHDLGYDVACVDRDPRARGIAMARRFGLPVVIGDAYTETALRAAGVHNAAALVSVTSSDVFNLETALQARAMRPDLRLVVSLFDDDLARRVERMDGNIVSRSVAYMAAPAFAAAMLEHQVLRTIAVGRHVLLIADVLVGAEAGIAGQTIGGLESGGLARVLALQPGGAAVRPDWEPSRDYVLTAGDRVIVVATRAGLKVFLSGERPVASSL